MKKSLIQNAILAGVLALFATFYFLYEKQLRPKHTAQEEKEKQLISIATTDIQEITLDRKGEAAPGPDGKYMPANWYVAKFRKAGKDWNIVSPVQDAGDGIAIEGMLSALGGARYDRVVDDNPKDLAVFGLVQPRFKIGVRKDDKSPVEEVWIGADTPVGSNTFVRLASSPKVYKVPSSLKYGVDKELKNFRNKNLYREIFFLQR